jgi:hypothetical protein
VLEAARSIGSGPRINRLLQTPARATDICPVQYIVVTRIH